MWGRFLTLLGTIAKLRTIPENQRVSLTANKPPSPPLTLLGGGWGGGKNPRLFGKNPLFFGISSEFLRLRGYGGSPHARPAAPLVAPSLIGQPASDSEPTHNATLRGQIAVAILPNQRTVTASTTGTGGFLVNIKQAKEYFELGVITRFYVVRDMTPNRWLICIEGQQGRSWTLSTSKGTPKSFASFDTVIHDLTEIAGRVSSFSVTI